MDFLELPGTPGRLQTGNVELAYSFCSHFPNQNKNFGKEGCQYFLCLREPGRGITKGLFPWGPFKWFERLDFLNTYDWIIVIGEESSAWRCCWTNITNERRKTTRMKNKIHFHFLLMTLLWCNIFFTGETVGVPSIREGMCDGVNGVWGWAIYSSLLHISSRCFQMSPIGPITFLVWFIKKLPVEMTQLNAATNFRKLVLHDAAGGHTRFPTRTIEDNEWHSTRRQTGVRQPRLLRSFPACALRVTAAHLRVCNTACVCVHVKSSTHTHTLPSVPVAVPPLKPFLTSTRARDEVNILF